MHNHATLFDAGIVPNGVNGYRARKRRKLYNPNQNGSRDDPSEFDDPLLNMELYAFSDDLADNLSKKPGNLAWNNPLQPPITSSVPNYDFNVEQLPLPEDFFPPVSSEEFNIQDYVTFDAFLPEKSTRKAPIVLSNPYADNAHNRIPSIKTITTFTPENGEVNGYVKFKIISPNILQEFQPSRVPLRYQSAPKNRIQDLDEQQGDKTEEQKAMERALPVNEQGSVVRVPPNFGVGCNLSTVERKIFRFYIEAWCSGRTILTKSNTWKVDLGPMLPASEPLRNALLAVACTYLFGYNPSDELRLLANNYYHGAVTALTKKLEDPESWEIGKGDDIVATFSLLNIHDAVTWECRRPLSEVPRWLEGARAASRFLDVTDPGYRYYKPGNTQASTARTGNTVNIARVAIFGLPFTPLDIEHTKDKKFGWLLYGTETEVHKIHGTCGYSPKLLHMWSQITHLAAKFAIEPDRHVIPHLAQVILGRLDRLKQWSDLSSGFSSTQELLEACKVNADGVIEEPWELVELGAECWKIAAQVYLLCRLMRYPRTHPKVLAKLTPLCECLKRIPCTGKLFTAMTPLLPCFLLGLVSVEERHRSVARNWFLGVINANPCRSCVPPSWEMMKRIWLWMETETLDPEGPVPEAIENREAWWERIVTRMMATEGTTCVH